MSRQDDDAHWHLDKRVPIALIFSILVQSGVILWWASGINERVNTLERRADLSAPQADRLTRVEVKIEGVQSTLDRIERSIRREP